LKGILSTIFFGNYFYGLCTIALSIEAGLSLSQNFNSFCYYLFMFSGTVVYYTYAYKEEPIAGKQNERSIWYHKNGAFVKYSQWILSAVFLTSTIYFLVIKWQNFAQFHLLQCALMITFPLIAAFYFSDVAYLFGSSSLRNKGWLKPFVIGFVWAGVVTIFPSIFYAIESKRLFTFELKMLLYFFNNFMFISILCIIFDIKDYATDHNRQLKTFVVQFGLKRTIYWIILPLSLLVLGTNGLYGFLQQYSTLRLIINIIPFILLIIVTYTLYQRKSILYYLAIIDGLMLMKGICGIIGLTFFK
jgi:hypothetical protein